MSINVWHKLLNTGIKEDMPFIEVQRTFMFNLFVFIAYPNLLYFLIANISIHKYDIALLNTYQLIVYGIGTWVIITRNCLWYRPLLMFLGALAFIYGPLVFHNGNQYPLLMVVVAAVVIFDKNWQYFLFALFTLSAFAYIQIHEKNVNNTNPAMAQRAIMNMIGALGLYAIALQYFKNLYFKYRISLEKAYRQLAEAKAEKDKFFSVVTHDLRNPISGIKSLAEVLVVDEAATSHQKGLLNLIIKTAANSLNLINDLLGVNSHLQATQLNKQWINANTLIRQNIHLLKLKANEKQQQLTTLLLKEPIDILADEEKINRVLQNLISNAIKFSGPGRIITVALRTYHNNLEITVKDNGIGIPKNLQNDIFNMPATAKRKGTAGEKSYGLGLSICKQIVEAHDGKIWAESKEGEGSIFYVQLPK